MAQGINRVTLLGNLGADPDLKVSQGGTTVLRIRLATTERYLNKDKEWKDQTEWHRIVVFGKRAEALGRILKKGSQIMVLGSLKTSSYEKEGQKHYSTDIIANEVVLCGSKPGGGGGARNDDDFVPDDPSGGAPDGATPDGTSDDNEIPF